MIPSISLSLSGRHHQQALQHLFPGDGKEAAVIALCGRASGVKETRLLIRELHPVPYEVCTAREVDRIAWPTAWLDPLLEKADRSGWSIVKIHSHPTDYCQFSEADDMSDASLFQYVHGYLDTIGPHASLVMLPRGELFGRVVDEAGKFSPLSMVAVVGSDVRYWHAEPTRAEATVGIGRPSGAFGRRMVAFFQRLSAAVVGCSGTGSIVVEQLARLGFGRIVIVDPQHIELRNLNRILNSTAADIRDEAPKVDVARRAIDSLGLGTAVETYLTVISDPDAIRAAASCNVLFGCVDGAEGRDIMNRIAACYLVPYIDVGTGLLSVDGETIDQIDVAIHYIQPGGSSLLSRRVYRPEQVQAEAMRRVNPAEFERLRKAKYIEGVDEQQPAVMPVNMVVASLGVMEYLARLYAYRHNDNREYAALRFNLAEMDIECDDDGPMCPLMAKLVGQGDREPLLGLPGIIRPSAHALA